MIKFHALFYCIFTGCVLCLVSCQRETNKHLLSLTYTQKDIQKEFDTLYSNQAVYGKGRSSVYAGFIEQALAICYDSSHNRYGTQDVLSSMYLDTISKEYNCVTTTVFHLKGGDITALGLFKLIPGDTVAPNHDFPIAGGTGAYANIYGTYTRKYLNGVYHVELHYVQL